MLGKVDGRCSPPQRHSAAGTSGAPEAAGSADEPAASFSPPAERWAPVGEACPSVAAISVAARDREEGYYGMLRPTTLDLFSSWPPPLQHSPSVDLDTVQRLEEEREQLDSSLLALTAHFAHVQLRLRQVASCPDPALKDTLLRELEEFASNGVPDVSLLLLPKPKCESPEVSRSFRHPSSSISAASESKQRQRLQAKDNGGGSGRAPAAPAAPALAAAAAISAASDERLRERQRAALEQLRLQLSELEAYAYEAGVADEVPTTTRVEKQGIIIEELRKQLHLSELENMATLSPERLRAIVDAAIAEIVNPAKVKEKVVEQLKTQVTDLERFVQFLQNEIDGLPRPPPCGDCACGRSLLTEQPDADDAAAAAVAARSRRDAQLVVPRLVSRGGGLGDKSRGRLSERAASSRSDAAGSAAAAASRDEATVEADGSRERRLSLLKRLLLVLQAFVISELGCGGRSDDSTTTTSGLDTRCSSLGDKHWGNLRARMEMTVDGLLSLLNNQNDRRKGRKLPLRGASDSLPAATADEDEGREEYVSDDDDDVDSSDDDEVFASARLNQEITRLVRKQLAPALQRLLEHGLREESSAAGQGLVQWSFASCFPNRSSRAVAAVRAADNGGGSDAPADRQQRRLHAWDTVMQYFELKNGREYTESPACKLSASFGLPVGDGRPTTMRQSLLRAVGDIVASHAPFRRSLDAHFKAFVCRALNEKKLTAWLRLVVKSAVASDRYAQHSYTCKTGFDDALSSLDRLARHSFNLPVDLAVSRLSGVSDAF